MVRNFTGLPALGLVFVAMLGIGLAEKFGLFSALMRYLALLTPRRLLTPVVVFVGANASVASDAGYIVLPPLAAALCLCNADRICLAVAIVPMAAELGWKPATQGEGVFFRAFFSSGLSVSS